MHVCGRNSPSACLQERYDYHTNVTRLANLIYQYTSEPFFSCPNGQLASNQTACMQHTGYRKDGQFLGERT